MFTERSKNNAVKLDLLCNFAAVYNLYVISHFFLLLPINHAKTMMYRMKTWLKNKPKGSSINDYLKKFFFTPTSISPYKGKIKSRLEHCKFSIKTNEQIWVFLSLITKNKTNLFVHFWENLWRTNLLKGLSDH